MSSVLGYSSIVEDRFGIDKNKIKIIFFHIPRGDSFLGDLISFFSNTPRYEVKKVQVTTAEEIDEGMEWADICWFEWCDSLIIYGSNHKLAKSKKLICRLHSYEAFTNNPEQVNWENVDKLIFVAEHIKNHVLNKIAIEQSKIAIIQNGIDVQKYSFREGTAGFNLAYVGYIDYKKGPMLLLHCFKKIYDMDNRYKLYIAGQFTDERYVLYFNQMLKELALEHNVFYQGWQLDLNNWLENKDYVLCTSVLESQNVSVMQAMSKGIKPLIHNFVGARTIYEDKYIWNSIDDCLTLIKEEEYASLSYRKFVEERYSLSQQLNKTKILVESCITNVL